MTKIVDCFRPITITFSTSRFQGVILVVDQSKLTKFHVYLIYEYGFLLHFCFIYLISPIKHSVIPVVNFIDYLDMKHMHKKCSEPQLFYESSTVFPFYIIKYI